jgi:hypothetical protein
MNSMEWLKSIRENGQKSPIPPVPPEGAVPENTGNALIPPVPPCSSKHFLENDNNSKGAALDEEIYWREKAKPETSGGHRGNQGFYKGNDDLQHRGYRGNQGNIDVSEPEPPPARPPVPYFTPGGTLVIPMNSDPKHHWWKGGQSVAKTRAEVMARMALECSGQNG